MTSPRPPSRSAASTADDTTRASISARRVLHTVGLLAVVLLLVTSGLFPAGGIGLAAADHEPDHEGNDSDNESGGGMYEVDLGNGDGNSTDETNESSGGDGGDDSDSAGGGGISATQGPRDGGGGGGGMFDSMMPTPSEWGEGTLEWITDMLAAGYVFIIDDVVNELLGTPRPVNNGTDGMFGTPVEDPDVPSSHIYAQLFDEFLMPDLAPIIGGILVLGGILAALGPVMNVISRGISREIYTGLMITVMAVVAYWDFITLLHTTSHLGTQFLLPDSTEIAEDAMNVAAGPLGAVFGMVLFGWSKGVLLLLMQAARWGLLVVYPFAFLFLVIGAYAIPINAVKMVSSFFIWQYYGLLVMNWPTAFLLRIALRVDFDQMFPESAVGEAAAGVLSLAVTMGFWIAAFAIPFLVMGSFGLASILGRGMFATKLAGGVASMKSAAGSGAVAAGGAAKSGGSTLKGFVNRRRQNSNAQSSGLGSSSSQKRAQMAQAKADGGWSSRKAATEGSNGSVAGRKRRYRTRGSSDGYNNEYHTRRKARDAARSAESERSGRRSPSASDRRKAARERSRASKRNRYGTR